MEKIKLEIAGMSCGHCVSAIRGALEALDGVQVEAVAIGSAVLGFDPERTTRPQIEQAISDAGYDVGPTQLKRGARHGAV